MKKIEINETFSAAVITLLVLAVVLMAWNVPDTKQNTSGEDKKDEAISKEIVRKIDVEYNLFWENYELDIRCPVDSPAASGSDYKKCLESELQTIKQEANKLNDDLVANFSDRISFPEMKLLLTWEELPLKLQSLKKSYENYVNDVCEMEGLSYQGEIDREIVAIKCKISETRRYMYRLMETTAAWFSVY